MKFLDKLERKLGKYAIYNLPSIIIGMYIVGFFLAIAGFAPYLTLNPALILEGQIWRILSFILIPPTSDPIWLLFACLFYYSICQSLVNVWGAFRFNLYYFSGIILTLLSAFILYFVTPYALMDVRTTYLNLSLFLAYATIFPNETVLIFFFFPVKVKWLGYLDALYFAIELIQAPYISQKIAILVAVLNFILFFIMTKELKRFSPKEMRRKSVYRNSVKKSNTITRHQCATCLRTEQDDPTLEFRFCSKCDGNYEYCQDHLFTHTHVKK